MLSNYGSTGSNISVIDLKGTEVATLLAHSAEVGSLQARNDINVLGNVTVGNSLQVGLGGINSNGPLSVSATTAPSYFAGKLGIANTPHPLKLSDVIGGIANLLSTSTPFATSSTSLGFGTGHQPFDLVASAQYLFAIDKHANGLVSFDLSNPLAPTRLATTTIGNGPRAIKLSGRYAYIVENGSVDLRVVDISNPKTLTTVATRTIDGSPNQLAIAGKYAYITHNGAGSAPGTLAIIDITPLLRVLTKLVQLQ